MDAFPEMTVTTRTVRVLKHLLDHPDGEHSAFDIAAAIEAAPGTVNTILRRLVAAQLLVERFGYLTGRPEAAGQARQRIVRFPPGGADLARAVLARWREVPHRRSRWDPDTERVWTVAELRAEVDAGRISRSVWSAIRRELRAQGVVLR